MINPSLKIFYNIIFLPVYVIWRRQFEFDNVLSDNLFIVTQILYKKYFYTSLCAFIINDLTSLALILYRRSLVEFVASYNAIDEGPATPAPMVLGTRAIFGASDTIGVYPDGDSFPPNEIQSSISSRQSCATLSIKSLHLQLSWLQMLHCWDQKNLPSDQLQALFVCK